MKVALRLLGSLIALCVLVSVVAFIAYDVVVFQPHRDKVNAILAAAHPEDRSPPALVRELVRAQPGAGPSVPVARELLTHFVLERRGGMLGWHGRFFVWGLLVRLHLSEEEILGLYCARSYNGEGIGVNALAQRLYGKPLSLLSQAEAATVVAYLHAPKMYARDPARLTKRRDLLLSRVGGA